MTVVNFNYPKFKYTIASTGQPGVGYKLFTYEEGTSTKKTTWTSLAKTAANANPIILDANGEADVWIDGNYKFVLAPPTDTDPPTSAVWTYNAIRSAGETSSATTSTSLPINGSFEDDVDADGVPDNWTVVAYSGGTVAIDSTTSTHGAKSLKFTSSGSGGGQASTNDYYEVEAGKVVGIRFSIISANANTFNKVQVYWYNAAQTFLSSSDAYSDAATNPVAWTRKYATVTAPATAKYARIVVTGVDPTSTTHSSTTFDNFELDTRITGESIFTDIHQNLIATVTELNYTDGVTSSIQTQIDNTAGRRGALVYNAGSTVIGSGSVTSLPFDTEVYDTSAIHDNVTNNSRLTVPSGVTRVRLSCQTVFAANITGYRYSSIFKNGATFVGSPVSITPTEALSATQLLYHSLTTPILEVSAGDYFTVVVEQTSGGGMGIGGDTTFFSMEIIK